MGKVLVNSTNTSFGKHGIRVHASFESAQQTLILVKPLQQSSECVNAHLIPGVHLHSMDRNQPYFTRFEKMRRLKIHASRHDKCLRNNNAA